MFCQLTNVQNVTLSNALRSRTVIVKTKVKQFFCGRQYKLHSEHVCAILTMCCRKKQVTLKKSTVSHTIEMRFFTFWELNLFSFTRN